MRRLPCAVVLALAAVVPAVGQVPKARVQFAQPVLPLPPQPPGIGVAQPPGNYVAPNAEGAVVELLDEGVSTLFPLLNNDNAGEPGTVTREDRDVFAGVEATRVGPNQKFSSRVPGWNYRIVETPKNPGEFRFFRFAWKKLGGAGIMIQLHDPVKSWAFRYFAGQNVMGWQPATQVADKLPVEWEVVTRDLFKEFGAITLTGIALTPFNGTAGLFDHLLLGRTVEDLDKATDAALGRVKAAKPLTDKERDAAWADVTGTDSKKAAAALRLFLATSTEQVAFIRERLADAPAGAAGQIHKLIRDLDSDNFETRQNATDELVKIGAPVVDAVREAGTTTTSDEVRFRARVILRKLGGGTAGVGPVNKASRLSRAVRVLERAATADARALLTEIAEGKVAPECSADAKSALARLPRLP